ncbi:MAG TPA: hypothetical protein PLD19_14035 [Luteimonas sp.]|nr:hypothetical protein [Luteimonas sp.]
MNPDPDCARRARTPVLTLLEGGHVSDAPPQRMRAHLRSRLFHGGDYDDMHDLVRHHASHP